MKTLLVICVMNADILYMFRFQEISDQFRELVGVPGHISRLIALFTLLIYYYNVLFRVYSKECID